MKDCLENSENQKTEESGSCVAPSARSSLEMPVHSVSWRGAREVWRGAPIRVYKCAVCVFC